MRYSKACDNVAELLREVEMDGGYDDGYGKCRCLWGTSPGSLVAKYLRDFKDQAGRVVYDLGCGEGKNAVAFAQAGASVHAIDCSELAIANARLAWPDFDVRWKCADIGATLDKCEAHSVDVVVMYGVLHCLSTVEKVAQIVKKAKGITKSGGVHIIAAFNDGPHDLSAHPGFNPLLLRHEFYRSLYTDWFEEHASSDVLHETHPHNGVPHYHSLTRLIVGRHG